jgi:hypothetical protein
MRIKQVFPIVALFAAHGVSAGTLVCSGTVTTISYHAHDILLIRLSSMNEPVQFCSVNQDWSIAPGYTTTPAMCKVLLGMFMTAKTTGESINSLYFESPNAPATCSGWSPWTSANLRYFYH